MKFEEYYQKVKQLLVHEKEHRCCVNSCSNPIQGWIRCGLSDYAGYCSHHKVMAMNLACEQDQQRYTQAVVNF